MKADKITALKTARFKQLARQLQECLQYCRKAERIGNTTDAYRDRKAELSRVVVELQAMGAWDCQLYYE
jgi:hypothetical protein